MALFFRWSAPQASDEALSARVTATRAHGYDRQYREPKPECTIVWERKGSTYVNSQGKAVPVETLLALRQAVANSRDFDEKAAVIGQADCEDVDKIFRTLFPWTKSLPPQVSPKEFRDGLLRTAFERPSFDPPQSPLLTLRLEGEPSICLSLIWGWPYYDFRGFVSSADALSPPGLPVWRIEYGTEEWKTRSFPVSELAKPFFPADTVYFDAGPQFADRYVRYLAWSLGTPSAIQDWVSRHKEFPGYSKMTENYRFISLEEAGMNDHRPGRWLLRLQGPSSLYPEIEIAFHPDQMSADWNTTLTLINRAENIVERHAWVRKLLDEPTELVIDSLELDPKEPEFHGFLNLNSGQHGTLHFYTGRESATLLGPSETALRVLKWRSGSPKVGEVRVWPDGSALRVLGE